MLSYIQQVIFGSGNRETSIDVNPKVNPYTDDPDEAWKKIQHKIKKESIISLPLDTPIYDKKIRFVCISDTHSQTDRITHPIPAGDILIHAGDFTNTGTNTCINKFSEFLGSLNDKFKYKVVIVGNHELSFDNNCKHWRKKKQESDPRDLLLNCIYLEDSFVELFGLKIYGAPWQPEFGNWGFNLKRGQECLDKWNMIPEDTDILITHGPPLGFGDIVINGTHQGCCELLSTIRERVKPKYHIFGHIHEDYGSWTDGTTTYVNASTCNRTHLPLNAPFIFDLDLPEGVSKDDFAS